MKLKILLLSAGLVASSLTLSGCGLTPAPTTEEEEKKIQLNVVGGTEDEATAMNAAVNGIICMKDSTPMVPDEEYNFMEDNGSFLNLVKGVKKNRKNVFFTWEINEADPIIEDYVDIDDSKSLVSFKYPGKGGQAANFTFKLKKVTCGSAVANTDLTYKIKIVPSSIDYAHVNIDKLSKVVDNKSDGKGNTFSGFDLVDYTLKSPYFPANNPGNEEFTYYYIETYGEVVYLAPDGNWGLIADGQNYMEIYAGSALNLDSKHFPALQVGSKVAVKGNMSQYCGNIQIGFISSIKAMPSTLPTGVNAVQDADKTYAPITAAELDALATTNAKGASTYEGNPIYKQAVPGYANSLKKVTGKYVKNSLSGNVGKGARFTCRLALDTGVEISIAYDYHVAKSLDNPELISMFEQLVAVENENSTFTISGTCRYAGDDSNPFVLNNKGTGCWSIVPFEQDAIVKNS